MLLMLADSLREKVGEGWALEIESFLGPVKWHGAIRRVLNIWGTKKQRFPGPNPFPLTHVMDLPASNGADKSILYSVFCVFYSVFCFLSSVFCVM
jgi:hypothetical protein